jgi:pyruvate dehydrogenase E1 component alpha subunit
MAVKTASEPKKKSPASKPKFSKETYIKWYKDMLLIRKFEEKTGQLYIQQKFGGFCHLYIGQEAIAAGTASACRPTDKHMTAYRDHAHPIALGTNPRVLMAELYGRKTGCSKGKGGSMHFFDKEKNLKVLNDSKPVVMRAISLFEGINYPKMTRDADYLSLKQEKDYVI